jgi:hypothetical protein
MSGLPPFISAFGYVYLPEDTIKTNILYKLLPRLISRNEPNKSFVFSSRVHAKEATWWCWCCLVSCAGRRRSFWSSS